MGYLLSLQALERSNEDRDRNVLVSSVSLSTCISTASTSICG
jgi:hypothetical protein